MNTEASSEGCDSMLVFREKRKLNTTEHWFYLLLIAFGLLNHRRRSSSEDLTKRSLKGSANPSLNWRRYVLFFSIVTPLIVLGCVEATTPNEIDYGSTAELRQDESMEMFRLLWFFIVHHVSLCFVYLSSFVFKFP